MKKKIFITGGTGMLGINLIHRLLKENYKLYVIYRNKKKLYPFKSIKKKINFVKLDLLNYSKLNKVIKKIKPDIVYHLASSYFNPPDLDLNDHLNNNFFITLNLLESLKMLNVDKFIFSGSAAVYKNGQNLSEKKIYEFKNDYGLSKLLCSKLIIQHNYLYNLPCIELRFFSIYGDWEKKNRLVRGAISSALKKKRFNLLSKDQNRDYIYVADAVEALIVALKKNNIKGIFNICSAKKQSTHKLVRIIYKKINLKKNNIKSHFNIKTNIIQELVGNNLKAKKILKWKPKFSIDVGLSKTISWVKNNTIHEN